VLTSVLVEVEDVLAERSHADVQGRFLTRTVALTGFMGVGKTSVGRELAGLLDRSFVDSDVVVETRSGRSIPELFAEGEAVFRRLEGEVVKEALDRPPCVLALGGGAFAQPDLAGVILSRALVVHLHVPWSVLHGMLPELARTRPLLSGRAGWQVQDLYLARLASYRRAHLRVSLPRHGPEHAAAYIAEVLRPPVAGQEL
jgi:shikimate kinase